MSRTPLVLGAIVVLAAAVALVVLLGSGGDEATETSAATQTPRPSAPPPVDDRHAAVTVTDRPRLPPGAAPELPAAGEHPREYAVGDVRVRDHRAGDHAPMDIPPNIHPADARRIPPTLTQSISRKVKEQVEACVKDLPVDAKGEKPRMEGQILIAIKDKQLTVTSATAQLRNVSGPLVDATKACIEQQAVGLTTAAVDEADLESYSINLSYALQ
jgi:hypothetical protein